MPPRVHLIIAALWLAFGIIAFLTGLASVLSVTFALSVLALVETRIGAWEAARAAHEARRQAERADEAADDAT